MNSSGGDNWHPAGGPPSHPGMDQMSQQPRPLGSFSQNPPPQQGPSSQPTGPVLPPPAGPYHPANQNPGHSLPGLAELSQGHGGPHQPAYGQHPGAPSHATGHSLPGIGQTMQHPSPQSLNRERERDSRERELIERQRQQEEMVHRDVNSVSVNASSWNASNSSVNVSSSIILYRVILVRFPYINQWRRKCQIPFTGPMGFCLI